MRNAVGAVGTVLLLGGRSEIGAAVAERLVRDGARRVVLAAREAADSTEVAAVAERLRAAGAREVHPVDFDAARPDTHAGVVAAAVALAGDLDVVVDAFGVLGEQAEFDADPAAAAEAATATYTGHVSAGLAVAARLREQGHGTLVVISSVAGVRVRRANFVYGSAKAGLDGFAQGLADSLHGSGARVMIVRPGYVATRMSAHVSAAPFPATAGQVADAVAEGLRTGAAVVWVPRVLRLVFAGMRLLPRPLWRRLPR
ncbi:decaprenylphospho-beta-D-erythro-pentofuranosid-2-ulose 2-reductase [Streptomonospora sp. S1-112]|uniref:Decaprenylphospho-beta-D-erythro-pentofuranosid-2-ulose 2-reductase n=1 Tax=Streptomonospora mangrovi TaxID=2883123 RepID=A0A9X3SGM3_9ACTN|nr:decaprenylphospho-beta-D-erythro-pentofuranosid-2-ulose 2-reductase [Streptomonospora mangrovi]MDA0567973.1 decaprenylphospho-beta-D-erythro-pentofuranosid-2-ulose 2-reductase [Streptomonospora mangrovi]